MRQYALVGVDRKERGRKDGSLTKEVLSIAYSLSGLYGLKAGKDPIGG